MQHKVSTYEQRKVMALKLTLEGPHTPLRNDEEEEQALEPQKRFDHQDLNRLRATPLRPTHLKAIRENRMTKK